MSAGAVEEVEELFRSIAKDAQRFHLPRIRSKAEEGLALWYERRSQPEEALAHHQNSQDLLKDEPATGGSTRSPARHAASSAGRRSVCDLPPRESARRLEREKLRDPDGARSPARLARLRVSEAGIPYKAAESGARLMALAPRLTDPIRVAQMHMNVARLFLHEGGSSTRNAPSVARTRCTGTGT